MQAKKYNSMSNPNKKKKNYSKNKKSATSRRKTGKPINKSKSTKPASAPVAPQSVIGMRLNKYVAHCGVCSRRQAAELIKNGKVMVNDKVIEQPGYQIEKGDVVTYEEKVIRPEEKLIYILMNKPKDVITSVSDDRGRKTVMDIVGKKIKERIFPVGRLDRASCGLLLLTNDGHLAQKLAHPKHKKKKFYHVILDKPVTKNDMKTIFEGVTLEDGLAEVDAIAYIKHKGKDEVGIELHSGKNRIIRRIFAHMGYEVKKLDRTYYAGLTKKDLPRGWFRHLTEQEVIMLKHFV